MAWNLELSGAAQKALKKLDPSVARRIAQFLDERVRHSDDPRSLGETLKGSLLGSLWKYRVGDYRIIADIQDSKLTVLVIRIGNRKDIYR